MMMHKSISKSEFEYIIILFEAYDIEYLPYNIYDKSVRQLRELRIAQVEWNEFLFFGFTLNDGETLRNI